VLCVVGDVNASQVEEAVSERFAQWCNPGFERHQIEVPPRQSKPLLDERPNDSEQVQIVLGHLGITRCNPDYHALQVLDMILGSGPGFTSRIPRVLRDELGLAYQTYCNITTSAGLYPGRFISFISTSPANRDQALSRLVAEIRQVIEGRFSDEELHAAQDFLTGNFVFDFESNYNVARFLLSAELFGLGLDYPRRFPERIRSVTRDEVVRVASQYLDPVNCTTVLLGPQT
ncbi:MAG: insulinase family protein, partial [Acidobacteriota bacterium]